MEKTKKIDMALRACLYILLLLLVAVLYRYTFILHII